jgi:lysophospholipase L1-like esterase
MESISAPQTMWGYQALNFEAFPLRFRGQTQLLCIRCMASGHGIRFRLNNSFGVLPLTAAGYGAACGDSAAQAKKAAAADLARGAAAVAAGQSRWVELPGLAVRAGQYLCIALRFFPGDVRTGCSFLANAMSEVEYLPGRPESDFWAHEPLHQAVAAIDRVQLVPDRPFYTVAAFGDSITHMSRWTAPLAQRMLEATSGQAVLLNAGICGNRLLHNASHGSGHGEWFGKAGAVRFEHDLFEDGYHADCVLFLQGINDILHPFVGDAPESEQVTPEQLLAGVLACAETAHRHHASFFAATVMPFNGCKHHWKPFLEDARCQFNALLRQADAFDGLLDYDLWTRDPADPTRLDSAGGSEDNLHPGVAGGRQMAEHIPLEAILHGRSSRA